MKIDRPAAVKGVGEAYRVQQPGTGSRPPVTGARRAEGTSDGLSLSPKSQEAASLRAKLREAPEVRIDLVQRIKARVEAGTYQVDPRAVAAKMLQSRVFDE